MTAHRKATHHRPRLGIHTRPSIFPHSTREGSRPNILWQFSKSSNEHYWLISQSNETEISFFGGAGEEVGGPMDLVNVFSNATCLGTEGYLYYL